MKKQLFLPLLFAALAACDRPTAVYENSVSAAAPPIFSQEKPEREVATQIANLIDPAKLATLKERGANPRIQKITAILATAKAAGKSPEEIAMQAVQQIGWADTMKGELTAAAILRNLTIAERLGATTPEDIEKMRRGNAPTVRRGPYAGEILSVDHIIPRSVAPELDNVISNLELMPLSLN